MRLLTFCLTSTLALLSALSTVQAQSQVGSYQPSRPTLSPYLYLTRPQAGPFPNYQTFVEPARNQQQFNQAQQTQVTQLQTQVQQQQQQQELQQQKLKQIGAAVMTPTGVGSVNNNLSHYYPSASAAGGSAPRGRPAARR
jgi:hypothetical protein